MYQERRLFLVQVLHMISSVSSFINYSNCVKHDLIVVCLCLVHMGCLSVASLLKICEVLQVKASVS
jgi:hypothetical protein